MVLDRDGDREVRPQMPEAPIPAQDLTITRVRRPDHELLVTLEAYDFEAFGLMGLRVYDLAVMAQAGAVYLAYVYDEIVGGCQLIRMADEPRFFYVVGFYIRPRWQQRGLGRAFLVALAAELRELGADGMLLTVAPGNRAALGLYRSVGFVDETFIPDFYGDGEDRHILRWRFDQGDLQGGV
jgi:ribosomal-protein-alanine N-acetyltransferase